MLLKKFVSIVPQKGFTPQEQLNDCLANLKKSLQSSGADINNVLKQTVFILADDNTDYHNRKNEFLPLIKDFYKTLLPPTSFIAQAPENRKYVALEVILLAHQSYKIKANGISKRIEEENHEESLYKTIIE